MAVTLPRVLVTHRLHDEVRQRLAEHAQVDMNDALEPWPDAERLRRLQLADAWLAFMPDHVDAALLAGAARLRPVACALKGSDSFDADACARAGVWLSIVRVRVRGSPDAHAPVVGARGPA